MIPEGDAGSPPLDAAAARAAATALRQAAGQLDHLVQQVDVPLANKALVNWKGPYADQFSGQKLPWIKSQAASLRDQMLSWASRIDTAAVAAENAPPPPSGRPRTGATAH
jgi:hypothetical protein